MKLNSQEKLGWILVLLFLIIIALSALYGCKSKSKYIICNRDICDTVDNYNTGVGECINYRTKEGYKVILCKEYIIIKE